MKRYDAILIGTGQATGVILPELKRLGRSLAIAEHDRPGGTCVNWGCTPTKALVASARVAHLARRAADFGIVVGDCRVDFASVMKRQNAIRNKSKDSMEGWLREESDFYAGSARFVSDHEVKVGDEIIHGETIYIHTGARARVPSIPGLEKVPFLDNKSILALEELPEHLIVIGGSYVGLEFCQIFERLGSRVTVLERKSRIMSREDPDISEEATRILSDEGVEIVCETTVDSVETDGDGVTVRVTVGDESRQVTGSHLLVAAGRAPETDELNLGAAGVQTDDRGFVVVDECLRTNVPHIYAIGDVNGRGAFTHTSVNDGQIIVAGLRGEQKLVSERTMIYTLFIDPPLGRAGMNEAMARESGRAVLAGSMPMSSVSRAIEKSETAGKAKVLVDAQSRQLLGATVFGTGGDEVINMLATWMYTGLPYTEYQKAVLVHPTTGELMPWLFDSLEPL